VDTFANLHLSIKTAVAGRLHPIPRKGGIKVRRLIAATSDEYRSHLFGMG